MRGGTFSSPTWATPPYRVSHAHEGLATTSATINRRALLCGGSLAAVTFASPAVSPALGLVRCLQHRAGPLCSSSRTIHGFARRAPAQMRWRVGCCVKCGVDAALTQRSRGFDGCMPIDCRSALPIPADGRALRPVEGDCVHRRKSGNNAGYCAHNLLFRCGTGSYEGYRLPSNNHQRGDRLLLSHWGR